MENISERRGSANKIGEGYKRRSTTGNGVTVGVRIRPFNSKEKATNTEACFIRGEDNTVRELDPESSDLVKSWPYSHVFDPSSTNEQIFETVGRNLVESALDGFNTVIFMYGQTSSGKTFTLFGADGIPGVVHLAMEHVHEMVLRSTNTEYMIKLTYAELYNEELRDLLSDTPPSQQEALKIVDDPTLGPVLPNITEKFFTAASDVKRILAEGEARRHFGVTNMNAHSSRSHVLVRLSIESRRVATALQQGQQLRKDWGRDKPTSISTLNLVDLAGSERANKSGTSGLALKEGSYINKSLLTLGTVISSLSEGKTSHVPYRDSKLTRLLSAALGGNAKTCMLTCISPAAVNANESLSTLRFAARAKRIVNSAKKNEFLDHKALGHKLVAARKEIELMHEQLRSARESPEIKGAAVQVSLFTFLTISLDFWLIFLLGLLLQIQKLSSCPFRFVVTFYNRCFLNILQLQYHFFSNFLLLF
jgi:centromeric protein E